MSRPVRIEFPGAVYHVTSRGSDRQIVFGDADDRGVFLNVLDNVVVRFGWLIHSYVLMDDHYHLVVEVPEANLSKGMRQLNGVYTQHVNRRHDQGGPIFHGRFKSILLEKKNYLLPVCRHVVTNPFRIKGAPNFSSYKWSSYRALAGQVKTPTFLHNADVLSHFGKREKDAQRKYREYVKEGVWENSPLEKRKKQVLLGSNRFLSEMQPILLGERLLKRGPKAVKRRRSLNALFKKVDNKTRGERNELMKKAHVDFGYTLMQIGDHLGLHYTTVSKVINA
jgi:REP element-mobilizing transposase RayT